MPCHITKIPRGHQPFRFYFESVRNHFCGYFHLKGFEYTNRINQLILSRSVKVTVHPQENYRALDPRNERTRVRVCLLCHGAHTKGHVRQEGNSSMTKFLGKVFARTRFTNVTVVLLTHQKSLGRRLREVCHPYTA